MFKNRGEWYRSDGGKVISVLLTHSTWLVQKLLLSRNANKFNTYYVVRFDVLCVAFNVNKLLLFISIFALSG